MIGEIIRQQREKLSLTQDQVAALADMSKPYLSNIETGKVDAPSDRLLANLEQALKFEPGSLRRLAHLERTPPDVRAEKDAAEAELEKLKGIIRNLLAGTGEKGERHVSIDEVFSDLDLGNRAGEAVTDMISSGGLVPLINNVAAGYPHNFTDLDYPPRVADEYVRCPDVNDANAFAARVVGDSMNPKYSEGDIVIFAPNTRPRNGADCFVRFAETNDTTFKRFYLDEDGMIRLQPLNPAYPSQRYPREAINGLYPAVLRIEKLA